MMKIVGVHSRLNLQGSTIPGSYLLGELPWLSLEEAVAQVKASGATVLNGIFSHLRAFEVPPHTLDRAAADVSDPELGDPGGANRTGNARNSRRKVHAAAAAMHQPVGETAAPASPVVGGFTTPKATPEVGGLR